MSTGEGPCNDVAPVMSDDMGARISGGGPDRRDIAHQMLQIVGLAFDRNFRRRISAQIRCPYRKAGGGERCNLSMPRITVFGEAMQQDDRRSFADHCDMQIQPVAADALVALACCDSIQFMSSMSITMQSTHQEKA